MITDCEAVWSVAFGFPAAVPGMHYFIMSFDTKRLMNFLYQTVVINKLTIFISVLDADVQCVKLVFRISACADHGLQ